jgi:hypothetical protein
VDFQTDRRTSIRLPGVWIDHKDRDWAAFANLLLGLALGQYREAVVCCQKSEPLITRVHGTLSIDPEDQSTDDDKCLLSIYAKSFAYGIETARNLLLVLSKEPRASKETKEACLAFASEFEVTKDIRDSLQHFDERAQGLSFNKDIPTSLRNLGSFIDGTFVVTSAQGAQTGIEVSTAVTACARDLLDNVIWSFDWLGPGEVPVQRPVPTTGSTPPDKPLQPTDRAGG